MQKRIEIKGENGEMISVPMRADAAVPILYRRFFSRDIFQDLGKMAAGLPRKKKTEAETLSQMDLQMISNLAYTFAKRADKEITDDVFEWLSQFDMMGILESAEDIIGMWYQNANTSSVAKKN